MITVYNQKSGRHCIFNYETLSISLKNIPELKEEKEKERQMWIGRANEALPDQEEWKKDCIDYADQAAHAADTAREIEENDFLIEEKKLLCKDAEEISEELYYDMLGCLPPYNYTDKGFLMSEFITGPFTSYFYKEFGKYYHRVVDIRDFK